MAKRPPTIPDSELDVLKVLWDLSQATVREAMETLRRQGVNGLMRPSPRFSTGSNPKGWLPAIAASWRSCTSR